MISNKDLQERFNDQNLMTVFVSLYNRFIDLSSFDSLLKLEISDICISLLKENIRMSYNKYVTYFC